MSGTENMAAIVKRSQVLFTIRQQNYLARVRKHHESKANYMGSSL